MPNPTHQQGDIASDRQRNSLKSLPKSGSLWLASFMLPMMFAAIGCDATSTTNASIAIETRHGEAVDLESGPFLTEEDASKEFTELNFDALPVEKDQEAQQEKGTAETKPTTILDRAKQGTASAGKWVKDKFQAASGSTSEAANGSIQWANETFQSLKDQGLTTANNTSEWLSQDWQNMESWEYKIVDSESLENRELEKRLNELGEQGWECFDVSGDRLMLKKPRESYLRHLPFKDLIRLAPLLNAGEGR